MKTQRKSEFAFAASTRCARLDEVRGLMIVNMILYHALWDIVWLYGLPLAWYTGLPGHLWQQFICWTFILLSGFCIPFGHHTLRRGAEVFGCGVLVSAVTLLILPDAAVRFGVLTLLGSAMLLTAALRRLWDRIPAAAGCMGCILLFGLTYHVNSGVWAFGPLPQVLYANAFTAWLGFPPAGFYSTDYFSLIPWIFLFWTGYFLHRLIGKERMGLLQGSVCPPLEWLGRHSLVVYLLHQPVIYVVLAIFFALCR